MNDNSSVVSSPAVPKTEKLSFFTKLAYGAGDLGSAVTANILVFFLSPFLTDVAGLAPGLAGLTQLIGKIWDAVNDPIVGVLSDRTNSKWGRRYPWMIFGAFPFAIFFFLQWIIPLPPNNQWGLFWYYTIISILFNACYTAVNLPYTALTPELTEDYDERTSLNSFRFTFSIGGSILSVIIFGLITLIIPNERIKYIVVGIILGLLSIVSVFWCVWGTRERVTAIAAQHPETEEPVGQPILEQLRIVFSNKPFLYVVGIYLCSWLAVQLTAAIIPYFIRFWMRPSEDPQIVNQVINQVILVVQGTAIIMLFVWNAVSDRYGKKAVYFMGMSLWIIAQAGLFFLQPGQNTIMYILCVLAGFGVSVAYLIPWSMLPDVIELDELRTGQRREGIFYSFIVFLQKVCLGLAVFVVLQRLEFSGYISPTDAIPLPQQLPEVLLAIRISIGPLPTLALIIGLILAYFYPITREVHAEILLQLRERRGSENN
ncbi:MAG: MFS transporter [Oscillatoriaceae bacterium SKW80]|nr:MFS transporter [Oscillatoriaceae bacterium SKYG93]MCX8122429.1 MFS transporter [Oscillatoriaceae bacterium SKW80]MDW8452646.1 MFS transporter [Oscillatoriaceae cyanobacterium SKYGB_i_bin93]HIK28028.1 MFS transporter [Oscillatoriaceae cyanobacterium M7585_C2015_266]